MVFLLLILWPLAEIAMAIAVAHFIGVLLCVLLLIAGWPLGSWLLRSEGRTALRHFQEALAEGRPPAAEVAEGALVLIGGSLFIIPGFITDAIGLLALIAPIRRRLAALLVRHAQSRFIAGAARFGAGARRPYDVDSVATDASPDRPGLGR
jgi:UPF0716 protein FxsA